MWQKVIFAVCCLLLLGPAWSTSAALVGWWPLDETSGNVAKDSSGQGNDGAVIGNAQWVLGKIGGALQFNGSTYVDCGNKQVFNITDAVTLAAWVQADPDFAYPDWSGILMRGGPNIDTFALYYNGPSRQLGFKTTGATPNWLASGTNSATAMFDKGWHHIAATYDGVTKVIYIDGTPLTNAAATGKIETSSGRLLIGAGRDTVPPTLYAVGKIDDAQLYDKSLTAAEIVTIMKGLVAKGLARNPSPADGTIEVLADAILSWTAGDYAATHDVYLGKTFTDVNTASRTNPKGVLARQSQVDASFDPPGLLAYGQTYYWRIDEVNQSPDGTIRKGKVWSFTMESYAYPITAVTATAFSAQANMGPEKTIDGSGLTGDLHGTDGTTMWLSTGALPNWIQYQFDKAYKVWDLKVWNSNQTIESFIGFGAKDVKIEYSTDGATWTGLANVPQFARAPGLPGYAANTTVSFGGVTAKYVKLTINSTWGGISTVTGLSEVRFSYLLVQTFAPQPPTGTTGLGVNTTLSWRPGREAASHKVFFGTDQAAVTNGIAPAKTVTAHAFDPGALTYGTKYYWRVDEVNTVTYPGDVWSFTTLEFAVVDDFESYDNDKNRIYDTWIDGLTDGKSGSTVGYMAAPFAETTIVHGGHQSMPLAYDNSKTPFYSETTRDLGTAQDWTGNGATHVDLWFRGRAAAFSDNGDGTYSMTSSGTDIWNNGDQFRFAYKQLNGNGSMIARVDSVANTNVWAKAGVMIRQTIDAGSTHAFMPITPGGSGAGNGASFQRRLTANGTSTNDDKPAPAIGTPYWVKIDRTGNNFSGYISPDGKTWTQLGTAQTIMMTNPVLIGLALCSHDATLTTTATFSNVSTTGTVTGSWQVATIGMAMPTNDPAPLYLTITDKAGKSKTAVNPNPSATTTPTWTEWRIPLSSLTGVSLTTVQKLTLGVGDKTSPKAGAAGMLYIDDVGFGHAVK